MSPFNYFWIELNNAETSNKWRLLTVDFKCCDYFTREEENNNPFLNINDVQGKVADALPINLRSVLRICAERKECLLLQMPRQCITFFREYCKNLNNENPLQ